MAAHAGQILCAQACYRTASFSQLAICTALKLRNGGRGATELEIADFHHVSISAYDRIDLRIYHNIAICEYIWQKFP